MRVGVIGCGYVFDHYLATRSAHPGVDIAGVADIDGARLMAALGINTFFDGSDARTLTLNATVANNPSFINAGHVNGAGEMNRGDNTTASAISSVEWPWPQPTSATEMPAFKCSTTPSSAGSHCGTRAAW